jgi:hypothetical protein
MSLDDTTPEDWDAIKKDRYYDNRDYNFKQEDLGCTLIRDLPKRDKPNFDWDVVNKPQHYRVGEVEAIDYIAQQLGVGVKDYLLGNVHKYLHRHRFKGQALEDLKKTEWYLRRLIMEEEMNGE